MGDGINWPVIEGCSKYDLTVSRVFSFVFAYKCTIKLYIIDGMSNLKYRKKCVRFLVNEMK